MDLKTCKDEVEKFISFETISFETKNRINILRQSIIESNDRANLILFIKRELGI